jgi:proline iminopeptidase
LSESVLPSGLYPAIDPFRVERVPAGAVHSLYVELSGNQNGFPVLFLHGGPGSQTRPQHRQFFDPGYYRIILFDQRGCGKSSPSGCTEENTTWHLVADMEALRRHLGLERWLLFGGSWGATLALAYAQSHPARVAGLILRGVFLATRAELEWYVNGLRTFAPEAWAELTGGVGDGVVARYHSLVNQADEKLSHGAAARWVGFEDSVMLLGSGSAPKGVASESSAVRDRARVQLHYLQNGCFLREGQLLDGMFQLSKIPTIIVQGRLDMVCPPEAASKLAQHHGGAELRMVENAGHSSSHPVLAAALRVAADDMRARLSR